jgi:predicted O-linked N-acetylglucosamine transferase (SPINDLY family)
MKNMSTSDGNSLNSAIALFQNGDFQASKEILEKVLVSNPNHSQAHEFLAYIAGNTGQAELSQKHLIQACAQSDCSAFALYYLGSSYLELANYSQAAVYFEKALQKQENFFEALHDLGTTQAHLDLQEAALDSYTKALSLRQDSPELYFNLARLQDDYCHFEQALQYYNQSIELSPHFVEAIANKAITLKELKRYQEAFDAYDLAIQLQPNYAEAWSNKGLAFSDLRRYQEALECYEQAIKLKPNYLDAWVNKSAALHALKRYTQAIEAYQQVIKLNPDTNCIYGSLVHAKSTICDWSNYDQDVKYINQMINDGISVIPPFAWLLLSNSEESNLKATKLFTAHQYPERKNNILFLGKENIKKIKLGYYSHDFYNHATAFLMAEFFELHNKERFEIVAFSFSPNMHDEMQQRLVNAFDQFIDVNVMTDQQVAELSREMGIDIAIDLKGYTTNCRTGIFSYRAAPIQVNYLGYPASMGANYMDYLIADHIIIPKENQPFFTEKIAYLPNSYQVNDSKRKVSERIFTRAELGLPDNGFVYCCFNNNLKITPHVFDSWARILKQVPGSVLWLLEDNVLAKANLIQEAQSRGLSEDRIVFAGRLDLPEHLARHRLADLFIDTLPCNAHTTASDALWVGLPVLTILGETFAGRVAASLLSAIDMPELITKNLDEYEALAIDLAGNPEKLKALKEKLKQKRFTTPLFNTQLSTNHIESAYIKMYERYQAGLPPEYLQI